jgi:fatty acid desaturase
MNGPRQFDHKALRNFTGGFAWPTLLLACATWAVFISAVIAFQRQILSAPVLVAILVICNFYSFTVLHEAVHENIEGKSRGGWITLALGWLAGAMFLAPFRPFKVIHLTHHQHTNIPSSDPDFWVASRLFLVTLLKCLTIYPHYLATYFLSLAPSRKVLFQDVLVIVVYWSIPGVLLFTPYWELGLYAFILPTLLGTGMQAFLFDWLPHHPHKETSQALNTRNFPGIALHVLMAGQNVHQLHHVNPRVPFHRYHAAFKAAARS